MLQTIKKLIIRHQSEILYLIIGGLTTIVNFAVYFITESAFHLHYVAANIAAWVFAVLFAYIANRIFVFRSKNQNILFEIWLFVLSRLFSLFLETGLLFAGVEFLHIDNLTVKVAAAVLVVICNYITGKLIVFKKR